MKVYEVHYDNGERWEDGFDCTEAIYATYEAAKKSLEDDGYIVEEFADPKEFDWTNYIVLAQSKESKQDEYVCSEGYTNCDDCDKYWDWIDSEYEEDNPCDEYENMDANYCDYDSSWYEIRMWEVKE